MSPATVRGPRTRDPAHVLYDHACELAAAAAAMRAESRRPMPEADVAGTLRCVGATLEALADAVAALEAHAASRLQEAGRPLPADAPARGIAERLREAGEAVRGEAPAPRPPLRPAGSAARRHRPRRRA